MKGKEQATNGGGNFYGGGGVDPHLIYLNCLPISDTFSVKRLL